MPQSHAGFRKRLLGFRYSLQWIFHTRIIRFGKKYCSRAASQWTKTIFSCSIITCSQTHYGFIQNELVLLHEYAQFVQSLNIPEKRIEGEPGLDWIQGFASRHQQACSARATACLKPRVIFFKGVRAHGVIYIQIRTKPVFPVTQLEKVFALKKLKQAESFKDDT